MADLSKAVAAIKDSRPPTTDRFTYLTILESHLSPEILPELDNILQDAQLTQDIGWDLVDMLIQIPGSETCLETIARLGNPREVILKVLEVLETLQQDEGYESDDERAEPPPTPAPPPTQKFITLLGMLAILHKRIKTKYPSRFLATSLQTVYRTYRPTPDITASVINLIHSLSGQRRPSLPTRKSSVNVANPDQDGDTSKNAPDPEADRDDDEDPVEAQLQEKLLLSFVTCILESYINGNNMMWAPRLLEYYNPTKLVPGKRSALQAFREDQELLARDAVIGKLVALTRDLGLSTCSPAFLKQLIDGPMQNDPLADTDDISSPEDIPLSTGGSVCLLAYWVFSSTVFEADQPKPDIYVFPEHFALLDQLLEDDAQSQIHGSPGTVEAVVAIGLWLEDNKRISPTSSTLPSSSAKTPAQDTAANFMSYLHLLTLIAVYHQCLPVRNAASALAGAILHADPADDDRLRILEDLLENCMFSQLKACAVTWLREELIAAGTATAGGDSHPSVFAGPDALDMVQYAVFPDLAFLTEQDAAGLREHWAANAPFVLQAINLALFLWGGRAGGAGNFAAAVPAGMNAAVAERWAVPLWKAAETMAATESVVGADVGENEKQELQPLMDLDILRERLRRLADTEAFKGLGLGEAGST